MRGAECVHPSGAMRATIRAVSAGTPSPVTSPSSPRVTLTALVRVALFYGVAGFGGGYSVLGQLRRELVDLRGWLSAEEFLVVAEVSKSLPGTPSTSLLAMLGQRVAGVRGGLLAAAAFLAPSAVLVTFAARFYPWIERLPQLGPFFDGMNAAMTGVVAAVTVELARPAIRSVWGVLAAVGCAALLILRVVGEPTLAVAAVVLGVLGSRILVPPQPRDDTVDERSSSPTVPPLFALGAVTVGGLGALAVVFVPIGVLTFGGGLAMIPAIQHAVVTQHHWLTERVYADAIAIGQITPGPVAICATFVGYRVAGLWGALVATLAMFGPATLVAIAVGRSVDRFRSSRAIRGALMMLAPVVIAMLASATATLGRAGIHGWVGIVIVGVSLAVSARTKVLPLWILVGGGVVQVAARLAGG